MAEVRKERVHSIHDAKNKEDFLKHARHALTQIEAGHYDVENMQESDYGTGRVKLSFERVEVDPDKEAHTPNH